MEVGQNMVIETMRLALEVVSLVGMQTKTMCPGEDHTTSHCIMTASMSQETFLGSADACDNEDMALQ
jgi:hypothetical protein